MKQRPNSPHALLCNCLTGALEQTVTASDLPCSHAEWQEMLYLAGVHWVTPQLRWALHNQGLLATLPPDIVEYLDTFYSLVLERNNKCLAQLANLIQMLNRIGVKPLLLKGSAAFVSGLYPTVGERVVGDIDILIPASRLQEIVAELEAAGYQTYPEAGAFDPTNNYHYSGLHSPDWPLRLELHLHAVKLPYTELLSREQMFRDAVPLTWRGGECLLPSPTDFIVHNVIHANLMDRVARAVRLSLRQLFEFVHATGIYGDRIDWNAVKTRFDNVGQRNALRSYVLFAQRFLKLAIPPEIDINTWDRLKITPYLIRLNLIQLEKTYPVVKWFLAFIDALSIRLKNAQEKPGNVKKLLTAGFYKRLWSSVFETLSSARS